MKKIGIAVDDHKLDAFKAELTAQGFLDFTVSAHADKISLIKVEVEVSKIIQLKNLCIKVNASFTTGK